MNRLLRHVFTLIVHLHLLIKALSKEYLTFDSFDMLDCIYLPNIKAIFIVLKQQYSKIAII